MQAHVTGLFIALRRGHPRTSLTTAELMAHHGLRGDAYAREGDREVVCFEESARRALEAATTRGLCYARFHENIRIDGLDLAALEAGTRLGIGSALLEVTPAVKRCYGDCPLSRAECMILDRVAFARVIAGGTVSVGDAVSLAPPERAAYDTRSRDT